MGVTAFAISAACPCRVISARNRHGQHDRRLSREKEGAHDALALDLDLASRLQHDLGVIHTQTEG